MDTNLIERLAGRSITREESLRALEREPGLIPVAVDGLASTKAAVRYGGPPHGHLVPA